MTMLPLSHTLSNTQQKQKQQSHHYGGGGGSYGGGGGGGCGFISPVVSRLTTGEGGYNNKNDDDMEVCGINKFAEGGNYNCVLGSDLLNLRAAANQISTDPTGSFDTNYHSGRVEDIMAKEDLISRTNDNINTTTDEQDPAAGSSSHHHFHHQQHHRHNRDDAAAADNDEGGWLTLGLGTTTTTTSGGGGGSVSKDIDHPSYRRLLDQQETSSSSINIPTTTSFPSTSTDPRLDDDSGVGGGGLMLELNLSAHQHITTPSLPVTELIHPPFNLSTSAAAVFMVPSNLSHLPQGYSPVYNPQPPPGSYTFTTTEPARSNLNLPSSSSNNFMFGVSTGGGSSSGGFVFSQHNRSQEELSWAGIFSRPSNNEQHFNHPARMFIAGGSSGVSFPSTSTANYMSLMTSPHPRPVHDLSFHQSDATSLSGVGGEDFKIVDPPPRRPYSGIWFNLQASTNQVNEPFLPQVSKNYLRIKDGKMTVRLLIKYLVNKLGLDNESEVEVRCRGQLLEPNLTLQHVRDNIWSGRVIPATSVTLLPNSSSSAYLSASSAVDHVMLLQYGRSCTIHNSNNNNNNSSSSSRPSPSAS